MAGGMPPDMGGVSPDMLMAEQMPMEEEEEQGSIEKDSIQLAGAVMERAGKDPQTAVAILEGAAGLIMQSTQQDPMMMEQDPMMMEQDPMMANMGGAMYPQQMNMGGAMYPQQMNMGGGIYPQYARDGKYMKPKYAAEGDYLSEESDTLRQMLMNGLDMFDVTRGQGMIINEGDLMGMGRTMSDADSRREDQNKSIKRGRLQRRNEEVFNRVLEDRPYGKTMSDADKDLRLDMGLDAQYYNDA